MQPFDATQLLLNTFAEKMSASSVEMAAPPEVTEQCWSYREAAAVLLAFRPFALRPVDPRHESSNPYLVLYSDLVPAPGGRERMLMTLKPEVRREALLRLREPGSLQRALDANPLRERSEEQRLFESWLAGEPPALWEQSYTQVTLSSQFADWLEGVVPGLPHPDAVREALKEKTVVSSFEHLASKEFVGRQRELAALRDYVGVLPSSSGWERAQRVARQLLKLEEAPPLLLIGAGGVGKSALVGRFLLEHANLAPEARFPFAYLPFDNPLLRVSDPFTIVIEAVGQFERQFPGRDEFFATFRRYVESYRDLRGALSDRATNVTPAQRVESADELNRQFYTTFGQLSRALSQRDDTHTPTLLVLDTFEEVQHRDPEMLLGLWRMLGVVQTANPLLRVIISGRAPVEDLAVNGRRATEMRLQELGLEDRIALLERLGVADRKAAEAVARQVGGNPLTLRLAARVMQKEDVQPDGLTGLTTRKFFFFSVAEELIRGQLYMRVLNHIHDADVRKLAHPGMVLRRVTPEIIAQVLGPICGVDAAGEGRKEQLFEQLRAEHAVVRMEADGSLHYRPEIRGPMLKLLKQDRPAETRAIHEAAVAYYRAQEPNTLVDRGEELYHLAMLDEDPAALDSRWMEGAGDLLVESLDELPAPAAAWLASRMSLRIDPSVVAAATLEGWERYTGRKVRELLRYSEHRQALELLRERAERTPGSALAALEARVLYAVGRLSEALAVLDRGIESAPVGGNRGRLAEMLWLKAVILEQGLNDLAAADKALEEAAEVAARIRSPLSRVQILTQRLALRERQPMSDPEPIRAALAEALAPLDEAQMEDERGVVRKAIGFLGARYPLTFLRALRVVGLTGADGAVSGALAVLSKYFAGEPPWKSPEDVHWWMLPGYLATLMPPGTEPDHRLIDDLAAFIRQDTGTIAAVTLAGIEEYREPWEMESSPEAV
jgi:tetratricopeptide (TPR) repeat protein